MKQPKDLDEVVDMLIEEIKEQKAIEYIQEKGIPHHGAGTSIRNRLFLWWREDHNYEEWPKEKPALVAWFNERGVHHADDMSGIISEAVQAELNGEEYDMASTVKRYKNHWKQWFKDGIPKPENKIE